MERAVACREGHYARYHHIRKDAPEACHCTSGRTIFKANNLCLVQPIPLGVTILNAVSKLKAQSSNVSFH